jgi:hypothetical protein
VNASLHYSYYILQTQRGESLADMDMSEMMMLDTSRRFHMSTSRRSGFASLLRKIKSCFSPARASAGGISRDRCSLYRLILNIPFPLPSEPRLPGVPPTNPSTATQDAHGCGYYVTSVADRFKRVFRPEVTSTNILCLFGSHADAVSFVQAVNQAWLLIASS